jgi:hypothetical protein
MTVLMSLSTNPINLLLLEQFCLIFLLSMGCTFSCFWVLVFCLCVTSVFSEPFTVMSVSCVLLLVY